MSIIIIDRSSLSETGGDWAGNVYFLTTCPSTCVGACISKIARWLTIQLTAPLLDFVNNNPSGFADAYFDFASIKIYE